mmetsp:Transcript_55437/g.104091  ORF Transcript_55437/g.104091 Transcript_55437/m.104091 type:complete len:399 (+) Transcript_55437:282-1478(+)
MPLGHGRHVGKRLHQGALEVLGGDVESPAGSMDAAVEAGRSAPILVGFLHQVEVAIGRHSSAELPAAWRQMEGSVQEVGLVVVLLIEASAHRGHQVQTREALLNSHAPPKLQHGLQLRPQQLWPQDSKDGLVVNLHVPVVVEILQQVLEMLLPVLSVAVRLRKEDVLPSLPVELSSPRLVGPGEEVGEVRLAVVENLVGYLPHHAFVVAALPTKPIVVVGEAMDAMLLGQLSLTSSNLALHQVVEAQSSLRFAEWLSDTLTFEVLQSFPVRVAGSVELVELRYLVILRVVHGDDLRGRRHRRHAAAVEAKGRRHETLQGALQGASFLILLVNPGHETRNCSHRCLQRLRLPPHPEAAARHVRGEVLRLIQDSIALMHQQQGADTFGAAAAWPTPAVIA